MTNPEEQHPERLHAFVRGRVQGVSFRWYTRQKALDLGLVGFARNLPDGRVEVIAEGERLLLEDLLAFLHRGSPGAHVIQVSLTWERAFGNYDDFGME